MEEKLELQKELLAAKQQLEKANGVPEIIKKYITNYNGKYLVFCKDKKHLYAMKDVVVGWFREAGYDGKIFEYPYYSNSNAVKKNLENFENNKEDGLKLLFVIDKLNEGLHLDEVHGCILIRPTTSNIIYYQQIGRAIDAGSMEKRVILDLVSNFNSLESFNLKKELEQKVRERRNGKFSECIEDFDLDKFDVVDCVQECVNVFKDIDDRTLSNYWSDEEINILKEYYPKLGGKCDKYLPNRNKKCIIAQAHRLNLSFNNIKKWTIEEENILKKYYKLEGEKAFDRIKNRTYRSCRHKVENMGLTGIRNKKSKYKYVFFDSHSTKWRVIMIIDKKRVRFGSYDSEDEAGKVAMEKAKEYGKAI